MSCRDICLKNENIRHRHLIDICLQTFKHLGPAQPTVRIRHYENRPNPGVWCSGLLIPVAPPAILLLSGRRAILLLYSGCRPILLPTSTVLIPYIHTYSVICTVVLVRCMYDPTGINFLATDDMNDTLFCRIVVKYLCSCNQSWRGNPSRILSATSLLLTVGKWAWLGLTVVLYVSCICRYNYIAYYR